MRKLSKTAAVFILSISIIALSLVPASAAQTAAAKPAGKISYMALGDSVSAGVRGGVGTPGSEPGSDKGYTDDIAGLLASQGVLGSFNKDFCVSGMTAKVLAQKTAVFADSSSDAAKLAAGADIVTLDVGANDLLAPLYAYVFTLKDMSSFDRDTAVKILKQMINDLCNGASGTDVQSNLEVVLQNILAANNHAKIFVMGYYNPLPVISASLGVDLNEPAKCLNTYIQKALDDVRQKNAGASIAYVDTFTAMAASSGNLVATDIHPTETGYTVIAGEFWKQIRPVADTYMADAAASTARFDIGGTKAPIGAYLIDGSNYIRLRDAAMSLTGTSKQVNVSWDDKTGSVIIASGVPYVPVGGELSPIPGGASAKALLSKAPFLFNGKPVTLTAYMIGDNSYVKLRDLAAALDVGLTWDASSATVYIDASKGYTA